MAIKNIKERLEGSYRLIRIRRIKLFFFTGQIAAAVILGLLVAMLMGARFEPFYFPVDLFAFTVLILVLIVSVEAIYFKGLEIRYTRNKSRRYLVARNAIRRSMAVIGIAGVLAVLMLLPYTQDMIADSYSPAGTFTVGPLAADMNHTFDPQGPLGLARAETITFTLDNDLSSVSLHQNGIAIWQSGATASHYEWGGLMAFSTDPSPVTIQVDNGAPAEVNVSYNVECGISPFIGLYLPAMCLAFIIVQLAAISVMYPIREKYATESIYSKKYVARTDKGEYTASEIVRPRAADPEETALLDSTLDLEIPPAPAPSGTSPGTSPGPARPEKVTAKGVVDEGLIEEPEYPCPSCGSMNSASAAMCFACGAILAAREKLALDVEEYLSKGESFASQERYQDAMACFDEVLAQDRTNERALLQKGKALHALGKWGSAVQYVNTALRLNPRNVEALVLKAMILEERDRLDKSLEIYSQILAIDPDNEFARGRMERVSEEAALEDVENVLEQFLCIPGIGLARATALYEAGFTSMEALKKASEADIARVRGISDRLARKIKKNLESM